MRISNNPERDMQEYEDELEEHMALFPTCEERSRSLMNEETVIRYRGRWYCSDCMDIMTNDEMREEIGVD